MNTHRAHATRLPSIGLLAAAFLLLPVTGALGQTEEDAIRFSQRSPATGARMMGMAGAGIGGVGDFSALYYNPAALGYLGESQLIGSLNFLNANSESVYDVAGTPTAADEASISRTSLANLGYAYKVPTSIGSLVFGVGLNQTRSYNRQLSYIGENPLNSMTDYFMPLPGEFEIEQDPGDDGVFDTSDDLFLVDFFRDISFIAYETFAIDFDRGLWYDGSDVPFLPAVTFGTVEQRGEVFEEGGMNELSFGGAVEAARGIMVGASANFTFGSYEFERVFEEEDIYNDNDGVSNGTTDFNWLRLTETLDTDMFGVNVRAGMSAAVTPLLRLGLTLETPTYLEFDESFGTVLEVEFDNGDFYDFVDEVPTAGEYRIFTPWRFGGGATARIAGLTVSADAEYVNWSEMRFDAVDSADEFYFDELNRIMRSDFEARVNTRVGAEYTMGPVAFRLGFAATPHPIESTDGIDRTREFITAGVGFTASGQMQVNLGWMREQFEDSYLPYADVANAPIVTEDVRRDRFLVGVKFLF